MDHVKCYRAGYPRPQFVREDWEDLNGAWRFGFGEEVSEADALCGKLPRTIQVPFSYETEASGIGDPSHHATVWYSRPIAGREGKRTILLFEGADYRTAVYVNGQKAGEHEGAYSRFSVDVTPYLKDGKGTLTVRCDDPDHPIQIRGKQRWERESYGCWYVQTTGIWKSVWAEYVNDLRLSSLKITPDLTDYSVCFDFAVTAPAEDVEVRFEVSYRGARVQTASMIAGDIENTLRIALQSEKQTYQVWLWSPEHPALYDLEIVVLKGGKEVDRVGSYFALREYVAREGKLLLNRRPYRAKLVLDQGYWQHSGLTPPDEEALARDIGLAKAMGFNGARKHQKIEDERYLYYADAMGFTVWCELPSPHWRSDEASARIVREWTEIVQQNYDHPSVVVWVVFNESWGVRNVSENASQRDLATGLYYLTKSFDPMRPVISNDGWEHAESDILTLHNYEQEGRALYDAYRDQARCTEGACDVPQPLPYAEGCAYRGQPIVISEFGGTAYLHDELRGWGYGNGVSGDEEFLSRFGGLVGAIREMGVSGYCYTQLTDVEQEVNGLLYADRTPKVPTEEIAKRNE